ncbi:CHRD domain-containing protein [Blastococcus sp. BMG 814]|uniref:CHRD domain-containing protein n=1 Tax=Blastococcus carthaginiensis TaxID=3050034 RepID=A0ABT9I7M7_9ACTN|nr:CHRD domain-containing protein [Blastococcus carthaginiensis]MDP5181209.1 CHRD domain-containing protein [Blastococcus carthaginiensis]
MRTRYLSAAALAFPLALATAGTAAAAESATIDLGALNDSGASGTAELVLDEEANTLTVNIDTMGVVPGLPHAQHIHIGGQNICPPMSAAGDDGVLSTPEGQPFYGGIQLSLTTEGDFGPDSALAVERFPVASDSGEVSYERTFDLSQIDGDINLADVSVVQHGIDSISPNGQYGPPPPASPLNPDLPLEATAPALCGATDQMGQMPSGGVDAGGGGTAGIENEALFALGAAGLAGAGALAYRRRTARGDV